MNKREEAYIIIGLILGILGCIAGWLSVPQIQARFFTTPTPTTEPVIYIDNPFAESDGIIWDSVFYGNIERKLSPVFEGQIQGARNGLRVDWGINSPNKNIGVDFFSAKFTTTYHFFTGLYCFVIEVDDGGELFIDGKMIRSVWWGYTPGAVYKTPIALEEGSHFIDFQYFEAYEKSAFHIWWYKDAGSECVTVGHPGIP